MTISLYIYCYDCNYCNLLTQELIKSERTSANTYLFDLEYSFLLTFLPFSLSLKILCNLIKKK